jgi:uncharacterized protein
MGDDSYYYQPKFMTYEIADSIIQKVFNHCKDNDINSFLFAFHGGEPLLLKKEFYTYFVDKVNTVFKNEIKAYYTIQTNGTLLTPEWAELFANLKIQIGISIDGLKEINDINRLSKNGKSSFANVIKGINNSLKYDYHKDTLGILTVINTTTDPIEFYEFLNSLNIKNIDFLFPYNHYSNLPENYNPNDYKSTIYADWLIRLFDYWIEDKKDNKIFIRTFNGFIESFFGEEFPTDLFGSYKNGLLVVETNGEIEAVDYLKSCGNNFTKTNLNINTHEISDVMQSELISLYYNSHNILSQKCLDCPIMEVCGGGNLTSRYHKDLGFDNASFMCKEFLKLITHIQNKVFKSLPEQFVVEYNLELLNYNEIEEKFNKKDYSSYTNNYLRSFKEKQYDKANL